MRTGANTLHGWTTDQLLAEVLRRSAGNAPALRPLQAMTEIDDDPFAAIEERLSPELRKRVRRLADNLACNDFCMAFLDLAQLHRALAVPLPETKAQATAAYVAMVLEQQGNDVEEWQRFFS